MLASHSSIPPWLLSTIAILLNQSPDGVHILDSTGGLIYANHTFLHMLGRTPADGLPRHVGEWEALQTADEMPDLVAGMIANGHPFLTRHRRRDGSIYDAAINVSTISHEGQSYLFCTVRDVTEQRRLEATVREREEQYRLLVADLKEVIFRTDAEGRWIFLNPAWHEITGFDVETSLGQIFLEYVYPDDRQRNIDLFQPLIERTKDHCRHEIRYLHRNGGFVWVDVSARLTLDEQGNATGTAGTLTDISERKLAQDALYESEARFRTIFFEDRSVKLLIDPQTGQIVEANQAATDFYGYPYDHLILMKIQEINQLSYEETEHQMYNATQRSKNYFTFRHRLASGEIRDVEVFSNTLRIKNKTLLLSFIHDVTEGRRAEAALRESEARHREMFENAPFAIARTLPDGTFLDVNPCFAHMFGYTSPEEFLAAGSNATDLYADPTRRADLWELCQNSQDHIKVESRYQRRDGSTFEGNLSKQIVRHSHGEVAYIESFIEDITERAQILLDLQTEHEFALTVMHAMGQGLTVIDTNGRFEYINPAYAQSMGYQPEELIGKRPEDLTSDTALHDLRHARDHRLEGETNTYESCLVRADGTLVDVQITGTPRWRDGKIVGSIAVVTDLTERKRIEAELRLANAQLHTQMEELRDLQTQLREQAIRDPLTNLYNRRYLDETLPREIARVQRMEHQLAVMMIDIDYFKQINDTYGHVAGDETLQTIAALIQSRLRTSDIACRYGGEEIICALMDTTLENALSRAEGIRHAIACTPIIQTHPDARVTVSIGVAMWTQATPGITEVIQAADMALYHAKLNGRNRVRVMPVE